MLKGISVGYCRGKRTPSVGSDIRYFGGHEYLVFIEGLSAGENYDDLSPSKTTVESQPHLLDALMLFAEYQWREQHYF